MVSGNPEPSVSWFKKADDEKEHPVDEEKVQQIDNGRVIVIWSMEDSHYGVYTCRANNTYGNSSASVSVGESYMI